MPRPAIDGRALLRWVLLELPETPWPGGAPFIGLVYVDPQAGLSAKGWRDGAPDESKLTVRLPIGAPGRILTDDEVASRGLPAEPAWLVHYGPQPTLDAPWRHDPALLERLHRSYPDDVQVVVHDGEPRRTGRRTEACWVRIDGWEDGAARPVTGREPPTRVYRATLLSRPHHLESIAAGGRLRLIASSGGRYPVMVTDLYLDERPAWRFTPCTGCGLHEGLDPPTVMAATRFPELEAEARPLMFTARCTACEGMLTLVRTDLPVDVA